MNYVFPIKSYKDVRNRESSYTKFRFPSQSDFTNDPYRALLEEKERLLAQIQIEKKRIRKKEKSLSIPKPISLNISGNTIIVLPELKHIVAEIERSKYILKLEYGWDELNAPPIPEAIWTQGVKWLIGISNEIFHLTKSGEKKYILSVPEINPCPNGSLDFSWRSKKARFLINIRMEGANIVSYYYGDLYNSVAPIDSGGPCKLSQLPPFLVIWMRDYLLK